MKASSSYEANITSSLEPDRDKTSRRVLSSGGVVARLSRK